MKYTSYAFNGSKILEKIDSNNKKEAENKLLEKYPNATCIRSEENFRSGNFFL